RWSIIRKIRLAGAIVDAGDLIDAVVLANFGESARADRIDRRTPPVAQPVERVSLAFVGARQADRRGDAAAPCATGAAGAREDAPLVLPQPVERVVAAGGPAICTERLIEMRAALGLQGPLVILVA